MDTPRGQEIYLALLQSVQTGDGAHPASDSLLGPLSLLEYSGRGLKLTVKSYLVPILRRGAIPPLPLRLHGVHRDVEGRGVHIRK